VESTEGRHRCIDGRDRNGLAAVSVHDELADDAAGYGALPECDEPICTIFPVAREALPSVEPEIVALDDHPDVKAQAEEWAKRRADLMRELYAAPCALKDAWLRNYFIGRMPDGSEIPDHQTKLKLAEPVDRRGVPQK